MFKAIRGALALAFVALAVCATAFPARADNYPNQPVKLIVGFPPGGTTDVIARLMAQSLAEQTGKSFVVENRPGASGSIGVGVAAKSVPDGYTLVVVPSTFGTASALYSNLPFADSDLVPVGLIGSTPYVLVVHPTMPVASVAELIALLKKNPGKYEYASSSPGTAQHLSGELFKRMAGVDILHVPYKGSGALLPDLLSGRVPMMFENLAVMLPYIRKGAMKPLAVTSAKRSALLPNLPTVAETGMGLEKFEVLGWFALLAPAKTPPAVVAFLNAEVNKMTTKPAMIKRFQDLGAEPMSGTPQHAAAYINEERTKWSKVIRDAGIKQQ